MAIDIPRLADQMLHIRDVWRDAVAGHPDPEALAAHVASARPERLTGKDREHIEVCGLCQAALDQLRRRAARFREEVHRRFAESFSEARRAPDGWHEGAWAGTHIIAHALQAAEGEGAYPTELGQLVRSSLSVLGLFAHFYAARPGATFDDLWVVAEGLEEAAFEVCGDEAMEEAFADAYGALARNRSGPLLPCMLAWATKELMERGPALEALANRTTKRLLAQRNSVEIYAVLLMLRRTGCPVNIQHGAPDTLAAALDVTTPVMEHAQEAAEALRFDRVAAGDLPRAFLSLVDQMFEPEPLRGMLALAGVKMAMSHAVKRESALSKGRASEKAAAKVLCEALFAPLKGRPDRPVFVAAEAIETLRDKCPKAVTEFMIERIPGADRRVLHGLCVCSVEGLEESFRGGAPAKAPSFRKSAGVWRFERGEESPLDPILEALANSARERPDRKPCVEWSRERLRISTTPRSSRACAPR